MSELIYKNIVTGKSGLRTAVPYFTVRTGTPTSPDFKFDPLQLDLI